MRIGFDFDKLFVDYPPFVPTSLVNWCYRNGFSFLRPLSKKELSYRIPGSFEQSVRKLTHFQFLRPPLKKNISVLKKIRRNSNHKLYLVSGRFGFLEKETEDLLDKYGLREYFDGIYFNFKNEQPHEFKARILKKEKVSVFVDDDYYLLQYLEKKMPRISLFWITSKKAVFSSKITPVEDLASFYNIYLKKNGK